MLQLKHIRKSYKTGDFVQVALDDISVAFRDNEFVAILGPSGSGKTTMLNIIGGLDHYDTGDLIIDGISTKQYKDRDWDTYRNNRIGFVFQSYNLIPHQSVLANVEMALTLSGVPREERRKRALRELERVGLGQHVNKRPNQLSGGQMQRVAIARALINDPEILLADEPTGALDSKTSIQIMDLLTEIAKDRLVVMVTHNPELAEQYATRTVTIADGRIKDDTDPFEPTAEDEARVSEKKVRRTSMGPLTALSLSFNNLMTKKGRTIMTAFAGSIGIIGIAAILALANGVDNYIKTVEEETLSEYPLQIMSTGFDMTAMLVGSDGGDGEDDGSQSMQEMMENMTSAKDRDEQDSGNVHIMKSVTTMLDSIGSNDLASLKEFIDNDGDGIDQYVNAVEYAYDVQPQVFTNSTDEVHQVHPDKSLSPLGLGSETSSNSIMSMTMSTDVFEEMPSDKALYEDSYIIRAGRWPEKYNELVLVTTQSGFISDFMLYTLGLRDSAELDKMIRSFAAEEEVAVPDDINSDVAYDDIVGITYKLVLACDYYTYDEEYNIWVNKSDDKAFMQKLVDEGETLEIVGIVSADPDAKAAMLSPGINYPAELTDHIIEEAAKSDVVKDQLDHKDTNVFTDRPFGEEEERGEFNMDSLFTINNEALQAAFKIDESKLSVDMSNSLNLGGAGANMPQVPEPNVSDLTAGLDTAAAVPEVMKLMSEIMQDFVAYNAEHPDAPLTSDEYLALPQVQAKIIMGTQKIADEQKWEQQVAKSLQAYVQTTLTTYITAMTQNIQQEVTASMQSALSQIGANMASAVSIDADAFANAFEFNMDQDDLLALMTSLMSTEEASYDGNLRKMGYTSLDNPSEISIYPKDFEAKAKVIEILDAYNDRMEAEGEDDKVISYTDLVGTLMASVTDIVDMISAMLIAFVAISLVVSSIMIGVITYISVLERIKEIGILRAIGASKGDISRIFNAETIIEGLIAGLLGVGITALGCIPANAIVYSLLDVPNIAILPVNAAIILVAISVFLSFIAGIIPASSASRKDPVEALRSE